MLKLIKAPILKIPILNKKILAFQILIGILAQYIPKEFRNILHEIGVEYVLYLILFGQIHIAITAPTMRFIAMDWNNSRRFKVWMLHRYLELGAHIILACTTCYVISGLQINKIPSYNYIDSLYFSIVTWSTLGYGDYLPVERMRVFSAIQALTGTLYSAGFIAVLFNYFRLQGDRVEKIIASPFFKRMRLKKSNSLDD